MHNFIIGPTDTDSISFSKPDGAPFSKEERAVLLKELNDISPELILWEDDGYYPVVVALRAKNYILLTEDNKIKVRGSATKDTKKEPALKEMLLALVDGLIYDKNNALEIYNNYIKECLNVKDISRWSIKKGISKSILACKDYSEQDILEKRLRRNETVVWDAVQHIPLQEGDKVYLYPAVLSSTIETKILKNGTVKEKVIKNTGLKLANEWSGDHDTDKLLQRVYNTLEILHTVLDMSEFVDYTLSKNKYLLDTL